MSDFKNFGLPDSLIQALNALDIKTPTPVQAAALPLALQGRDILASARTGSGKTFAFGLPLITHLLSSPDSVALVVVPTRELAVQVRDALSTLMGQNAALRSALLIGGDSMEKQLSALRRAPRLIVGTPGRINDHLMRKTLKLDNTRFLVLDEADRMLDMGFGIQIDNIAKYLPAERQTLLFSATFPANIQKLSARYLTNPERITVESDNSPAKNIIQEVVMTPVTGKFTHLLEHLGRREGSVIVFVKTKRGSENLADKLARHEHSATAIHGDLRQRERDRVIRSFRNNQVRILVATDVAARGLDIPHIRHVINYDLPQCAEDYIHRIGRTARAGLSGEAVCLVSPEDAAQWKAIHKLMYGKPPAGDKSADGQKGGAPKGTYPAAGRHNKGNTPSRSGPAGGSPFPGYKPRAEGGPGNGGPSRKHKPAGSGGGFAGKPAAGAHPGGPRKPRPAGAGGGKPGGHFSKPGGHSGGQGGHGKPMRARRP